MNKESLQANEIQEKKKIILKPLTKYQSLHLICPELITEKKIQTNLTLRNIIFKHLEVKTIMNSSKRQKACENQTSLKSRT